VAERQLQSPHGGELVDLMAPPGERDALKAACTKSIELSDRNACDVELLTVGCGSRCSGPELGDCLPVGRRLAWRYRAGSNQRASVAVITWCLSVGLKMLLLLTTLIGTSNCVSLAVDRGFSPLKGFMNEEQYDSVVENMRLPVGDLLCAFQRRAYCVSHGASWLPHVLYKHRQHGKMRRLMACKLSFGLCCGCAASPQLQNRGSVTAMQTYGLLPCRTTACCSVSL